MGREPGLYSAPFAAIWRYDAAMSIIVISESAQEFLGVHVHYKCGIYFQRHGKRLHRVVWSHYNGTIPRRAHIHHRDLDTSNNHPDNLVCVTADEHLSFHGKLRAGQSADILSSHTHGHPLQHGTPQQPAEHGIRSTGNAIARRLCMRASLARVMLVGASMTPSNDPGTDFAPPHASQNGGAMPGSMTSSVNAKAVAERSSLIGTRSVPSVRASATNEPTPANTNEQSQRISAIIAALRSKPRTAAQSGAVTVVAEPTIAGKQRVYNLSVAQAEEYFANGVLVHNCRYACMSRPFVQDMKREPVVDSWSRAFQRADRDGEPNGWRVA